jgi:hypothetical protein
MATADLKDGCCEQASQQESRLSPELKVFIRKVILPLLVQDWRAARDT